MLKIFFCYVRGSELYQNLTGAGFQTNAGVLILNLREFMNIQCVTIKVYVITFQPSNVFQDYKAEV